MAPSSSAIQNASAAAAAARTDSWIAWVGELLGATYAIYALVGAVLVTDLSPATSRRLAVQRLFGTLIGAVAGALLLNVLPNGPVALGLAICGSMLVAFGLGFELSGARVAGYVAAIVMFAHRGEPWLYAFERAWETVVGIVSALLVGLVPLWIRDEGKGADGG